MYKQDDIMFKPNVKTIQLVYDSSSAIANGDGVCNFQMPVQGYYNVYLKDIQSTFISTQVSAYGLSSPQLRTSYTCSNTNGTNGDQTANKFEPLSNIFVISNRQSANSLTVPILFPRCLLQNTIQIKLFDYEKNIQLPALHIVILTLELHPCENVIDTATHLFPLV